MKRLMVIVMILSFTFLIENVEAYKGSNGDFDFVVIVPEGLNLRSGPGTQYETLGIIAQGDILTKLDYSDGWYEVKTIVGLTGWVCAGENGETWLKAVTYEESLNMSEKNLEKRRNALEKKKNTLLLDLDKINDQIKALEEDMQIKLDMIKELAKYGIPPGELGRDYEGCAWVLVLTESEYNELHSEIYGVNKEIEDIEEQMGGIEYKKHLIDLTYNVRPKAYEAAVGYYEKGMYRESLSELDKIEGTLTFPAENKIPTDEEILTLKYKVESARLQPLIMEIEDKKEGKLVPAFLNLLVPGYKADISKGKKIALGLSPYIFTGISIGFHVLADSAEKSKKEAPSWEKDSYHSAEITFRVLEFVSYIIVGSVEMAGYVFSYRGINERNSIRDKEIESYYDYLDDIKTEYE